MYTKSYQTMSPVWDKEYQKFLADKEAKKKAEEASAPKSGTRVSKNKKRSAKRSNTTCTQSDS